MPIPKALWKRNWVQIIVTIVHLIWGLVLLFDRTPIITLHNIASPLGNNQYLAAFLYLSASALAIWQTLDDRLTHSFRGMIALSPQHLLVAMNLISLIYCMITGYEVVQYDKRFTFLIFCSQMWFMACGITYFLSQLDWFYFSRLKEHG